MKVENPGALRFFLQDDVYLLHADKVSPDAVAPKPLTETPENKLNYLGKYKKRFLITVHYTDQEFIPDAHLTALESILQRIQHTLDDVAILNMATTEGIIMGKLLEELSPEKLLILGKNALPHQMDVPALNQLVQTDNHVLLYSFSFDDMMNNTVNKRTFWEQVKSF